MIDFLRIEKTNKLRKKLWTFEIFEKKKKSKRTNKLKTKRKNKNEITLKITKN